MYNSLEVRVPFLDKRVIDFAWRVYPEYGNKHHELKLVLKNAMEQFYPKKIIYKPKKGFSIPYSNYLKNELKQDILDHVVNSKIFGESFLNSSMVKSYVEGFINYGKGDPWGVWIIYAIQKWAVKYNLV
jgi:asparagine synthase (glutamine-hydrolysing)